MGKTKISIIVLSLLFSVVVLSQNFALKWHGSSQAGPPTNCIAEWLEIGARTSPPAGFDFVTNSQGLRFYVLFSETNFNAWNNSNVFVMSSNRAFWITRRDLHLSNVIWFSTNVSVLNATLGSSNLFMLRAAEERLR